ncbi:hypothetical protein AAL_07703 [Moelleriella libera RCEF 2490]|uniref:Uncharacterized protein n=1 Tax=Moelleriella libera RCEF 2490 TaxID=1081109 RepID=A0A167WXW9_9HYPO|nr:hypothetical protein AAL_07703 [Moelleriella libera RCEF 2490]
MQPTLLMAAARRGSFSLSAIGDEKNVWKAYAIALRSYMTTQTDLDSSSRAIFVASPGLVDIPAGACAPKEITNEHIFRRADALQDTRSPFYTPDGDSYFNSRRKYLQGVHDNAVIQSDVDGSISKLRSELQQAQDRSAEAYLRDLDLYNKSTAVSGPGLTNFESWVDKFGVYYAWARGEQKRLEQERTLAATKTSSSVGLALAAFELAQDTSTLRLGSTMPCSKMDIPTSTIRRATSPLEIPPQHIYYRPLYSIGGIDMRIDSWVDAGEGGSEKVHLDLDLAGARTATWASLGFPNLDNEPSYETKTAKMDVELSLEAAGMQAFAVDRGLWVKIKVKAIGEMKNQLPSALLGVGGDEKGILGMPTAKCTLDHDDGQIVIASAPSGFPAVLAVMGREI